VKILFVGHLNEGQTSLMRMISLRDLGHDVRGVNVQSVWDKVGWLSRRLQQRVNAGPAIARLNERVVTAAREHKPDLVWAEKQENLEPETLLEMRKIGARLLHFTPDPYFTLAWKRTKLMDECMPLFDYLVTSKRYELEAYRSLGPHVIYMPLGFSYHVHRPLNPSTVEKAQSYASDIGFVGGWEPRREELLTHLADAGHRVRIWGYAWDHISDGRWTPRRAYRLRLLAGDEPFSIHRNDSLAPAVAGGEVYSDEYAWSLSGARIGVGFLRTICPDQHTTRTFEIPACRSMLLADRTEEHQEFFQESAEAEFFSSAEELVDKARYYLSHETERARIADGGYTRSISSGYSYDHRVAGVLSELQQDR
jgi:spore maturation protein CgeB